MSTSENDSVTGSDVSMYVEPLPKWDAISKRVGNGWFVFPTFGAVYTLLSCVSICLTVKFRRKICRRTNTLILLLSMDVSCIIMGLYLIADPYAFNGCLPGFVVNITEQCTEPVTIIAFLALQNDLICLASVKVKWNTFQTTSRILYLMAFYLISMTVEELIYIYVTHNRLLRLLSKLSSILLSLYTCVCFLCTGFKTAVYLDSMKSTNKICQDDVSESYVTRDSDSMTSCKYGRQTTSDDRTTSCRYELQRPRKCRSNYSNNRTTSCMLLDSSPESLCVTETMANNINDGIRGRLNNEHDSDDLTCDHEVCYSNKASCVIETEAAIHALHHTAISDFSPDKNGASLCYVASSEDCMSIQHISLSKSVHSQKEDNSVVNKRRRDKHPNNFNSGEDSLASIGTRSNVWRDNESFDDDVGDMLNSNDEECVNLVKSNESNNDHSSCHSVDVHVASRTALLSLERGTKMAITDTGKGIRDTRLCKNCVSYSKDVKVSHELKINGVYTLQTEPISELLNDESTLQTSHSDSQCVETKQHDQTTPPQCQCAYSDTDSIDCQTRTEYQCTSENQEIFQPHCLCSFEKPTTNAYNFQPGNDDALSTIENGYLADGETLTVNTASSASHHDSDRDITSGEEFTDVKKVNSRTLMLIKSPSSCYSLMRLRQCAVLQKVISVGYFITFGCIVDTIFQMYSLFGVYGIFGSGRTPNAWPWYLFHVLHRSVSVLVVILLLLAVSVILNNRTKRRKGRRHREERTLDTKL